MSEERTHSLDILPEFDDRQWAYLLRTDALTVQIARYTATLEVLQTYYREISAAHTRHPSPELRALRARTIARIREVTTDAAQVLAQEETERPHPPA